MAIFYKIFLKGFIWFNAKCKGLSIRLVKWSRKSSEYIHPKHLLEENTEHHWYLKYIGSNDTVLDVGCGNGVHTMKAAQVCKKAVGFDFDKWQLRIAEKLAAEKSINNIEFYHASAEAKFPFEDRQFDNVLFLDCLEHLNKRDIALQEIRRVLKDKGLLLLSAPNRDTSWKRRLKKVGLPYYSDPDHKIEYTERELKEELMKNGFEIEGEMMPVVHDTPFAGLIDLVGGISLTAYKYLNLWKRNFVKRFPEESIGFRAVFRKKR